jgi:hypothetical protein
MFYYNRFVLRNHFFEDSKIFVKKPVSHHKMCYDKKNVERFFLLNIWIVFFICIGASRPLTVFAQESVYNEKREILGPLSCKDFLFKPLPMGRDLDTSSCMWRMCYLYCMISEVLKDQLTYGPDQETRKQIDNAMQLVDKILKTCFIAFRVSYFVFRELKLRDSIDASRIRNSKAVEMEE